MTAPTEFGGRGFSQMGYCRLLEVIGSRCSSTAIFVNAHHSIGMRALLLFGTDEQKRKWLPDLVSGRKLAAFALTEPEAGSDAANVQTIGHAVGGRHRLRAQRREAIHHQRGDRGRADRHGPHARGRQRRDRHHRVSRHARHAGISGRRTADGETGRPRHGDRAAGVPRHARAAREHPRAARQGTEGGADGARLRPHDVRRVLHGRGENLPATRVGACPHAAAVRPHAGRVRTGAEETRPHGRVDVCAWRR